MKPVTGKQFKQHLFEQDMRSGAVEDYFSQLRMDLPSFIGTGQENINEGVNCLSFLKIYQELFELSLHITHHKDILQGNKDPDIQKALELSEDFLNKVPRKEFIAMLKPNANA